MVNVNNRQKTYVPTEKELTESITNILQENKTADWKSARKLLHKKHPTWRVPERRVKKFVKRSSKVLSPARTADTFAGDASTDFSTQPQQDPYKFFRGGLFKGKSSRRKNNNNAAPESAPVKMIQTTESITPPPTVTRQLEEEMFDKSEDNLVVAKDDYVQSDDNKDVADVAIETKEESPKSNDDETPMEVEEPVVVEEGHEMTLEEKGLPSEQVYKDDNDGKIDGNPCAPCEGCIIS